MAGIFIKKLAKFPGLWRVDGIGEFDVSTVKETKINVHLSCIYDNKLDKPYHHSSLTGAKLTYQIHPASLPYFKIGSIWQDGKCVLHPPVINFHFHVNVDQAKLIRLNEPFTLGDKTIPSIIPESYFTLEKNRQFLKNTFYTLLPVLGSKKTNWMIIPASELFCFYIGVSRKLLTGALFGRLDHYVDWEKCIFDQKNPALHRKTSISRKGCLVLLRALSSKSGQDALYCTRKHIIKIKNNNALCREQDKEALVIRSIFPFTGTTTLTVCGKYFPLTKPDNNNNQEWAIFAMELMQCTYQDNIPNPCIEDSYHKSDRSNESGNGEQVLPLMEPNINDDEDYEINDLPGDKRITRLAHRNFDNKFTVLENMEFNYIKSPGKDNHFTTINSDMPVTEFTHDDCDYSMDGKNNLGLSNTQLHESIDNIGLINFILMVKQLRNEKKGKWKINTRSLETKIIINNEVITSFPTNLGKRYKWYLFDNIRPRYVVWVEVYLPEKNTYCYLAEMELRENESGQCTIIFYKNDLTKVENTLFSDLLFLTAIKNRWPLKSHKYKKQSHTKMATSLFNIIKIERIIHPPTHSIKSTTSSDKTEISNNHITHERWADLFINCISEYVDIA